MISVGSFEFSQADLLGHGAFALVFRGRRKQDNLPVAVKQIALKSVPGKLSNIRQKEITILKDLRNPHVVQLYDYMETPSDIFLVMEYCNGGDLGDYLIAKKTLSESSIRHLSRHMALALQTLYELHIIHRDIKPQNLLLSYPHSSSNPGGRAKGAFLDATIKLADFGFARYLTGADMAHTLCGSPLYMAPEILMGRQYDSSADLWSVGTILFQCLSGSAPFIASNPHALKRRYEREKLVPKIPEGTSHQLRNLLLNLLKKNAKERLSYAEFFQHDFLKDPASYAVDPMLSLHPSQTLKSSPVPIKRQSDHPPHHRRSSYRQSSPHRQASIEISSISPSSGPPLSHKVGSQASLPYYSAQSPNTDVTDQGFVLVDFPGGRRCSVSSNGSGTTSGKSSGRNSTPGHPYSSHTPSSAGSSLSRYSSLTTPFYQPQPGPRQSKDPHDLASTPVNTTPQHCSGIGIQGNSGLTLGQFGPSPPSVLPFGGLIPHVAAAHSPSSNVSSYSYRNKVSPGAIASPLSTPPSSSPGAYTSSHYTKPALARRNSGTKLSALAEETEKKRKVKKGAPSEKANSGGFDIITQSCLLGFSEDESDLDVEEENFPLSLNSSVSVDPEDEDRKREEHQDPQSSTSTLQFVGRDAVHFNPRPGSSSGDRRDIKPSASMKRRAASFSYERNPHLSQQLAALHSKASSLSAHNDTVPPSLSSEIVAIKAPFVSPISNGAPQQLRRPLPCATDEQHGNVKFGSLNLSDMTDSLTVVRELHAMAKARQGPILLLSTSAELGDSGISGRKQRCSEQVVLYAKAIHLVDSLSTRYGVELATNSQDPPDQIKKVMVEAEALRKACLHDAKLIHQEILSNKENGWNSEVQRSFSAERLLFLEALDMCKAALLDEKSVEAFECVKRYRRAKTLFQHLLSESQTQNDKLTLEKYIRSAQARLTHLLS